MKDALRTFRRERRRKFPGFDPRWDATLILSDWDKRVLVEGRTRVVSLLPFHSKLRHPRPARGILFERGSSVAPFPLQSNFFAKTYSLVLKKLLKKLHYWEILIFHGSGYSRLKLFNLRYRFLCGNFFHLNDNCHDLRYIMRVCVFIRPFAERREASRRES